MTDNKITVPELKPICDSCRYFQIVGDKEKNCTNEKVGGLRVDSKGFAVRVFYCPHYLEDLTNNE